MGPTWRDVFKWQGGDETEQSLYCQQDAWGDSDDKALVLTSEEVTASRFANRDAVTPCERRGKKSRVSSPSPFPPLMKIASCLIT